MMPNAIEFLSESAQISFGHRSAKAAYSRFNSAGFTHLAFPSVAFGLFRGVLANRQQVGGQAA